MASEELLEVVDRSDAVLHLAPRGLIHARGLMHRAVHVLVLAPDGRVYLQKRSHTKDTYPGCWTSSASGHVDPGEGYAQAARRELAEELGLDISPEPLAYIPAQPATGWEFTWVFTLRTGRRPHPDPAEIAELELFDPAQALQLAAGPAASASLEVVLRALYRYLEG